MTCSQEACGRPVTAKGLCHRHWYHQYTPSRVWADGDLKRCPSCKVEKLGDGFYPDKKRGRSTYCKDCTRQKALGAWRSQAPEKRVGSHLKRTFGISVEEYQALLSAQGEVCAVCGRPETVRDKSGTLRSLSVDHCHTTGAIRGLLCTACNVSLGRMDDDPARLRAAADYLERSLVR